MNTADRKAIHAALQASLDEGELAVCWTLQIDVAGPDGRRYLAHRAGGGVDGMEAPMAWTALGMLQASANLAASQLREQSGPTDEDQP